MEPETTTHLERRDPARNMKRFYRLAVERDLFGTVLLVREWGRIGTLGRVRHLRFPAARLPAHRLTRVDSCQLVGLTMTGRSSGTDLAQAMRLAPLLPAGRRWS